MSAASAATYKKMSEIDEEYHVSEKVQAATAEVARGAQELDRKYDISGKTSRALTAGAAAAVTSFARLTAKTEDKPSVAAPSSTYR